MGAVGASGMGWTVSEPPEDLVEAVARAFEKAFVPHWWQESGWQDWREEAEAAIAAVRAYDERHQIRAALEATLADNPEPAWSSSESPEPSTGLRIVSADDQ